MSLNLIKNKKQTGFTLIELIIVIGVLSILATASIAVFNPLVQFAKANDARRKSDLSQIQKALETYYQDNGRYPANPPASDYRILGSDGNPVVWGNSWQPYMNVLPKDPISSHTYVYVAGSDGQSYYLYANLDRGDNDSQVCHPSPVECDHAPKDVPKSCGGLCNFGISSPNTTP